MFFPSRDKKTLIKRRIYRYESQRHYDLLKSFMSSYCYNRRLIEILEDFFKLSNPTPNMRFHWCMG